MHLQLVAMPSFRRVAKKMHPKDKAELDKAVLAVANNPELGELKKGDLGRVQVYKFKMNNQDMLLAYTLKPNRIAPTVLELLSIGTHENFYTDLKKIPNL